MSFINIYTNNLSRELRNSTTFVDNWAYVPGTAITGDWKTVYPFTSLDDFNDTCGDRSPEGSITHEIVAGLLNSGIPVLFRRIACVNQDTSSEELGVTRAEVILSHYDSDESADHNDVKISEKYGGTFGNDMTITVRNSGIAYWLEVYLKYTLLERKKLININKEDSQEQTNQKLIDALKTTEFDRIVIDVLEDDPQKFELQTVSNKALSGGTDFDESKVAAEIPRSYDFIKDKILYQPKFLTSGGYTDEDMSTSAPIAEAMLNLSLIRQDCRALIDIPIGTPAEDQQELAASIAYQQLSDDQAIPSGSICAPWQYMQVGTEQVWMPPSYVYLTVVGNALSKGGKVYTPKAGVASGQVANILRPEFEIGSDLSEQWQSDTAVNINPIMRLQGGRFVIAGNSTILMPESTSGEDNAFSESSADLAVIEIRRFVYNLATELQYQYNAVTAFETFSIKTAKFLEGMMSEGAVGDYNIYNMSSDTDPRTLKIRLDVSVMPTIKNIEIYLNISYGSVELNTGGEA